MSYSEFPGYPSLNLADIVEWNTCIAGAWVHISPATVFFFA